MQALPLPDSFDPSTATSEEAAAMMLSGNRTTDPREAEKIHAAMMEVEQTDADEEERSRLMDAMGFSFDIKIRPNKMWVQTRDKPTMRVSAKLLPGDVGPAGSFTNEAAISRLVDACIKLKSRVEGAKV